MLKDYLSVAQDALRTQRELYHVKEQRLALALDEYVRLNDAYKEKSSSRTSCKYSVAVQTREVGTDLQVTGGHWVSVGRRSGSCPFLGRRSPSAPFQIKVSSLRD